MYFESDAVFIGRVLEREFVAGIPPDDIGWIRYAVEVDRVFKGELEGTVQVLTEDASARWIAEVGRTYLVSSSQGRTAATCGPLDDPNYVAEAEAEVRALLRATDATIEGEVVRDGGGPGADRAGAGIRLRVSGTEESFEVRTNGDGRFRLDVPPGRYRLHSEDLRPTVYSRQDVEHIELQAGQCAQFQLAVGDRR